MHWKLQLTSCMPVEPNVQLPCPYQNAFPICKLILPRMGAMLSAQNSCGWTVLTPAPQKLLSTSYIISGSNWRKPKNLDPKTRCRTTTLEHFKQVIAEQICCEFFLRASLLCLVFCAFHLFLPHAYRPETPNTAVRMAATHVPTAGRNHMPAQQGTCTKTKN